jgi:hypothetical protein
MLNKANGSIGSLIISSEEFTESDESETNQIKNKRLSKKIELHAAPHRKGQCLMCDKKRGLHVIKPESIHLHTKIMGC